MAERREDAPGGERIGVRDRILDAAVELLRSGGLKRMGQTQVAKAAGVPQGHLTYYFPRKHDLMVAVARRSVELIGTVMKQGRPASELPSELRELLVPRVVGIIRDRERTRMLLSLVVESDDSEELRALLRESAATTRGVLAQSLGIDADGPLATAAQSFMWGLGIWAFLVDDPEKDGVEPLVRQLDAVVSQWMGRP